jgi:phosphatidylglycerol lysyltransferase
VTVAAAKGGTTDGVAPEPAVGRLTSRLATLRRYGPPLLGAALLLLAALVLHRSLADFHYRDLKAELGSIGAWRVAAAIGLTALSFAALVGYEVYGLAYASRKLPLGRVALVAFTSQAIAHSTSFATLVGAGLRLRLYAGYGLDIADIAKVPAFFSATFGLGMATLLGLALALEPGPLAAATTIPAALWRTAGAGILLAVAGTVVWRAFRSAPLRIRGHELELPAARVLVGQILLALADLGAAAAALWFLLPGELGLSFPHLLAIYVMALLAGLVSHVPGGLGVFEGAVVLLLRPPAEQTVAVVGALLAYRAVYYLLPLLLGAGIIAAVELRRLGRGVAARAGEWTTPLVPLAAAWLTLLTGVALLASGATPAEATRLAALGTVLPLPTIELAHFAGSLIGAALLLVAHGLLRRLSGAWTLGVPLLAAGVAASLAKGLDWEEALLLLSVLGVLVACRREFHRRSRLLEDRLSPGWWATLAAILIASVWLLFFAYKHVDYQHTLWWQFELEADAPRSLRATMAVALVLVAAALHRLIQPAPAIPAPADVAELAAARAVVERSGRAATRLALTGDKAFLFNGGRSAFVMYGVSGRSWVAMSEPVGPEEAWPELVWAFHEAAERHGARTVFYEVGPHHLPLFLDLGLRLVKLGESAKVPLAAFSLKGKRKGDLRNAQNRAQKEGAAFEVLPPNAVPGLIDELERVSNAWLGSRNTREKRFSLGFFSRSYLEAGPVAMVRQKGRIVAFANLWLAADKEDCSIDLMRFLDDAPPGTMDFLMVQAMLWARAEGYRWFELGMAPLAGLPEHRLAPAWSKLGRLLVRHGAHFYNFEGLRAFKAKFEPVWEPAYLACPDGTLPRVLGDVAALVAGGWGGIIRK